MIGLLRRIGHRVGELSKGRPSDGAPLQTKQRMRAGRVRAYYDIEDGEGAPVVQLENVGVRYGMGPEVLRDLTFSIEANSFQFLTGPSGAGKTTLLRLILMSVRPTRGLISIFGQDVSDISKDNSRVCAVAWAWSFRISACSTISPPTRTWPCPCGCRARRRLAIGPRWWSSCAGSA